LTSRLQDHDNVCLPTFPCFLGLNVSTASIIILTTLYSSGIFHNTSLTFVAKRKRKYKCVSRTDTVPLFAFDIAYSRAQVHGVSTGGKGTVKKGMYAACIALFLAVAEIRKVCKWSKIRIFSNFLAHPVETPWPTWMALCQNVRRSVPYIRDHT